MGMSALYTHIGFNVLFIYTAIQPYMPCIYYYTRFAKRNHEKYTRKLLDVLIM